MSKCNVARIDPPLSDLANTIAVGLLADGKAGRLSKIGIEEVEAAVDAREHRFRREDLINLTLRKLIAKVG